MIKNYDAQKNVLYVGEEKPVKRELRGFVVTVADSQEDVALINAGDHTKMKLSPVMAPNEQSAINVISQQGKIPLSIISYEYLKFQVSLLENLSKTENITLLIEHQFKVNTIEG